MKRKIKLPVGSGIRQAQGCFYQSLSLKGDTRKRKMGKGKRETENRRFVGKGMLAFYCVLIVAFCLLPIACFAEQDTLRPTADACNSPNPWSPYPAGETRWGAIDDTTSNGDINYIYALDNAIRTYIWRSNDWTKSGTINWVKAVWVMRATTPGYTIKIARGQNTEGACAICGASDTLITLTTSYTTYSRTWATNDPCTGNPWSLSSLNNDLNGFLVVTTTQLGDGFEHRVTQSFIVINYTPPSQVNARRRRIIISEIEDAFRKDNIMDDPHCMVCWAD